MDINRNLVKVLNDLIVVNSDRIEGYYRPKKDSFENDSDLKVILSSMVEQSRQYIGELSHEVFKLGEEPATAVSVASGTTHRLWMDVKTAFAGYDWRLLLESCELGEDAIQKAYQQALVSEQTLSIDSRLLIARQKEALKVSQITLKNCLDLHREPDCDDNNRRNALKNSAIDLRKKVMVVL